MSATKKHQPFAFGALRMCAVAILCFFVLWCLLMAVALGAEQMAIFQPSRHVASMEELEPWMHADLMVPAIGGGAVHTIVLRGTGTHGAALFAHGNGGNISSCTSFLAAARAHFAWVVAFDYRGYGKSHFKSSPSRISEKTTVQDLETVWRFCGKQQWLQSQPWTLIGYSLGGGVVSSFMSHMALRDHEMLRPIKEVTLVATFRSVVEEAAHAVGTPLVSPFVLSRFDNEAAWTRFYLACPLRPRVTVVCAAADTLIPPQHTKGLAQTFGWPLLIIQGFDHWSILDACAQWFQRPKREQ